MALRGALRIVEHDAMVYRRTWRGGIVTTILGPFLFLASMGLGLGGYVDRGGSAAVLGGVSYLAFLAPGLLAAQAMQTAAFESTYPILGRIQWDKTYLAALATPIGVDDLVWGELGWIAVRLTFACGIFLIVMAGFGAVHSPLAVLDLPVAVLTGLAFAAPIVAFSATQRRDSGFNAIFRFGVTPLFLFSGTFFPVDRLPEPLQPVAWITPLYHGVDLARALSLGRVDPLPAGVHLVVLVAFAAGGVALARAAFRRRLRV